MEWLYNDTAVNIAGIISALSAAGFAMLALFTDYKKDGKVTKFGRISVVGISVSAMLSVFVTLAKADIAERASAKAREETKKRDLENDARDRRQRAQFEEQIGKLTGIVTAQQTQLDLAKQSVKSAQATIEGLTLVSQQQQRGTTALLQDSWRNANRIGSRSISASFSGACSRAKDAVPTQLFREGIMRIVVKRDVPGDDPDGDVTENIGDEGLVLSATTMRPRLIADPDAANATDTHEYEFTDFSGDIAKLSSFEDWRGTQVTIIVAGLGDGAHRVYPSDDDDGLNGMLPSISEFSELTGYSAEDKRSELSCIFQVSLEINGRTLLTSAGFAFETSKGSGKMDVVIGFSLPMRIENSGIPRVPRGIF